MDGLWWGPQDKLFGLLRCGPLLWKVMAMVDGHYGTLSFFIKPNVQVDNSYMVLVNLCLLSPYNHRWSKALQSNTM